MQDFTKRQVVSWEKKIDEVDHYISVFRVLVDNYVENKAAPRTSYDLNVNQYDLDSCTNVITLAARYEEIIQAMHEEVDYRPRIPYYGESQKIFDIGVDRLEEFANKTVMDVWAGKIEKGKLDLGDMRDLFKKEDMAIQNKILMYHTMKQVIDNRSVAWYFNPLNWRDWHHQRNFMAELAEEVEPTMPKFEKTGEKIDGLWHHNLDFDEDDKNYEDPTYENTMDRHKIPMIPTHYTISIKDEVLAMLPGEELELEYRTFANKMAHASDEAVKKAWFEYLKEKERKLTETETDKNTENEKEAVVGIDLGENTTKETAPFIADTIDSPIQNKVK